MAAEDDPQLHPAFDAELVGEVTPFSNTVLLERLQVMRATHGFIPTSPDEANDAYNLLTFLDTPGKTATHLNEILLHQTSDPSKGKLVKTDNPGAAVRSVTQGFTRYAKKARSDLSQLRFLEGELAELDSDMNLRTLAGARLQSGIPQLVRYHDLRLLVNEGTTRITPFASGKSVRRMAVDPYTVSEPTRPMRQHMAAVTEGLRIWQAKGFIKAMVEDQEKRRDFWADRLHEAMAHAVARPIATVTLSDLGLLPPPYAR